MPVESNLNNIPEQDKPKVEEYIEFGKEAGGLQAQIDAMIRELKNIQEKKFEGNAQQANVIQQEIIQSKELLKNKTETIVKEFDEQFASYFNLADTQVRANHSLVLWGKQKDELQTIKAKLELQLNETEVSKSLTLINLVKAHDQVKKLIKDVNEQYDYKDGVVKKTNGTETSSHCHCKAQVADTNQEDKNSAKTLNHYGLLSMTVFSLFI